MIEKILLDYMKTEMYPIPVYMEEPVSKPSKYVLIEKTGSGEENYIQTATFAFKSYADSLYNAADLNRDVKLAVCGAIDLPGVFSAKLNSDYNFTDTTTKRYRYQAVFNITYQEETI